MASQIPVVSGGISYTSPSFNYGQTGQAINGGYSFDLPLASVAAFTNQALDFSTNNTQNAQGFLSGVINQAQGNLNNATAQSFTLQGNALSQMTALGSQSLDVQKYAIKKQSQSLLQNTLGGCFITTAVTKAAGLPDDCEVLQVLRKFRDEVLKTTDEGAALVAKYYAIAPTIVAGIESKPEAAGHFNYLLQNFILPAAAAANSGDVEKALAIYTAVVDVAHVLAGSPELPEVQKVAQTVSDVLPPAPSAPAPVDHLYQALVDGGFVVPPKVTPDEA